MGAENVTMLPPARVEASQPAVEQTGFGLPPDLQAKACKRLGQFALLMTVLVVLVAVFQQPVWHEITTEQLLLGRIPQVLSIVLSAGLFLVTRSRRLSHSAILRIGLVYEFLFCLVISVGYSLFTAATYGIFAALTMATLVIAVYPLIVPSPPRLTLFAALASAATAPLGVLVASLLDLTETSAADYLGVSIYPAMCVVLAVFGSRIVYGLNTDVARARELGSYRLEEILGKGGMGEVWRAKHRLLARPAAVKLIRPQARGGSIPVDESIRMGQRFEREAQVTASLKSPHTVGLYDFGQTDDGDFYYVMELLDGVDLDSMVTRYGPLSAERVVFILRQLCQSLAEAHDVGLVHRDIKPANLLLCQYGRDFDFVKVLDFGLVALGQDRRSQDLRLTRDGIAGGTPAYMPPEMAAGREVDGRTDIYAVGCVAYWLLTGRRVFEAKTPMALILAHMDQQPKPPSEGSEIGIPRALDEAVLACLEKDPSKRPQDADELTRLLDACPLDSPWTAERARTWWQTHRPQVAARASQRDKGAAASALAEV
jgi:serine/threonine-protein kinase